MIQDSTPLSQSPIMLANEIAKTLNIGRSTAYRLLDSGKIQKVKLGCKIIGANRADVMAFLQSRTQSHK